MRSVRRWVLIVAVGFPLIATACVGQPGPAALAPSAEPGIVRTAVTPAVTDIVLLETFPVQVRLVVEGELPNPCSRLGWYVKPGDDQGRIEVALYADQATDAACIQTVVPFSEIIPIGAFEQGTFVVLVNDQQLEEFTLP
jgi:hypothetical protein